MEGQNRNREEEHMQHINEVNENTASRNPGNNTAENQRTADEMVGGEKGHQQQGNHGSRQGDGGNHGSRGNTGLG